MLQRNEWQKRANSRHRRCLDRTARPNKRQNTRFEMGRLRNSLLMRRNSGQYLGGQKGSAEEFMTKLLLAIGMSLALLGAAFAQQNSTKEQIVGAWSLVSVISETGDGKRGEPFGTAPKGVMIFSSDGHFSLFQSRAEIPKIAANDRAKATPEEAQAIVASAIAYYGTYSIDEASKVMSVELEASTFANVAAIPNQKRTITG